MGSSSTTTQNNRPYEPAQPLIDEGLRDAQNLYQSGGFEVNPYQGDLVAGFDPLRQGAYNAAGGVTAGNMSSIGQGQDALRAAMDPTVPDAVKQNVIQGILPSINSTFAGSGMTGSDLHQQNVVQGLSSGLADVEDQYQRRAMSAAGMMPGLTNAANGQFDWLNNVGSGMQDHQQNLINADVLRDQQGQTVEMDALRNYLALSTGAGSQFGVQTSTTSQSAGPFGILGAGLQMLPFLSDRRVKEDIRRVGETDGGLPIYTYRYKGGDTYHMGVMAQDVEAVNPDAVADLPNGLKAVYYQEVR